MMRHIACVLVFFLCTLGAFAQQTGSITGDITSGGQALPGVVVTASSDVLPQPRSTVSNALGKYRLPALPPGNYEVTATMTGMNTAKRKVAVRLGRSSELDIDLSVSTEQQLTVAYQLPLVTTTSTELQSVVENTVFEALPVGEEYRDLVKLAPGVQVTADSIRGPSAGGSGQDNIYKFDGVDVSLPLFGTLSAEPSTHDIKEVSVVKGGSQAINYNRSGGFTINTVSKSGTNNYEGNLEFRFQTSDMEADRDNASNIIDREFDRTWASANVGGPLVKDRLFFYASYFAPTVSADNSANVYGSQPDLDNSRGEGFIKLTASPSSNFTIHASYRDSSREVDNASIGGLSTTSTAVNEESDLRIAILEGDWIIGSNQSLSFKYSDFQLDTSSLPANILSARATDQLGTTIDLNNLDQLGLVELPTFGDDAALNNLYAPFIERYGYLDETGTRTGGGFIGADSIINIQDFARSSWQIGYDVFLVTGDVEHDIHVGYRWESAEEDLGRRSNGWGFLEFGGSEDQFLIASFITGDGRNINSEFESNNIEINDNITWGQWNFNVGVMLSNDIYYGQGLEEDPSAVSGFRLAPGNSYQMYEIDFDDMIQPRLGVIRELDNGGKLQASFGIYNPPASSLPRAASWDRNILGRRTIATFNSAGTLVDVTPAGSSSGKFFQDGLEPRQVQEMMFGYERTYNNGWTGKGYVRYRKGSRFWEDTNNTARSAFRDTGQGAGDDVPSEDYIPELGDFRADVGGSSYVIAQLDGAFTKYYEATFDAEKRGADYYFKGTYTWSHYYGNFDQDATSDNNDLNIFIGSSFLADGGGRNVWDNRYGNLAGDRRHVLKLFGTYTLPWKSTVGAFALWQSGEPWEAHSFEPYVDFLPSWDRDDTSRYAEPAGSRRSPSHTQLDLNYTHLFRFGDRYGLAVDVDIFNVLDNQTERNFDTEVGRSTFGQARSLWEPRKFRLSARLQF